MLSRRVGNIQASLKYLKMNQALATDLEQDTEVEILPFYVCYRILRVSRFLDNTI